MRVLGNFFSRYLIFEIVLFALLSVFFWTITRVLPTGELSDAGFGTIMLLENAEEKVARIFSDLPESPLPLPEPPRSKYEMAVYSAFCGMAEISNIYIQNSSSLSYFVVVPIFLILIFAYNTASPEKFGRASRVILSTFVLVIIITITFKLIEIQGVQAKVLSLDGDNVLIEEYSYRCERQMGTRINPNLEPAASWQAIEKKRDDNPGQVRFRG